MIFEKDTKLRGGQRDDTWGVWLTLSVAVIIFVMSFWLIIQIAKM